MTQALRVVTEADEAAAALERARAIPALPEVVAPRQPITAEIAPLPSADAGPATSWTGRLFALSLLVATVGGLGWLGREVYFVITDSWIAPLHLSPDSDGVAALRMQRQRQLAELARLDAEVTRVDGELAAIDAAVVRLDKLRAHATTTRRWQTEASARAASGLDTATDLLRRQRALLVQLSLRQAELVARARADLAAGLIDRTALDLLGQRLAHALGARDPLDRAPAQHVDRRHRHRHPRLQAAADRVGIARGGRHRRAAAREDQDRDRQEPAPRWHGWPGSVAAPLTPWG